MPSQPLPLNDINHQTEYVTHCGYKKCLAGEERFAASPEDLIRVRLLGYMLREGPAPTGRETVASEIVRCEVEDLPKLGLQYQTHFLRCFRSAKGRTPIPSRHLSAPSMDLLVSANAGQLQSTPSNHSTAKQGALLRDGYRCMLTGRIDATSLKSGLVLDDGKTFWTSTRAAHIFDRSTNADLDDEKKMIYAASVHAILDRFGRLETIKELNGANVHRLENILTLATDVHDFFDSLSIWLEKDPNDPPNTYKPTAVAAGFLRGMNTRVTFTTHDPVLYPLPDPRLLELHAACARIAHLSGAGEYADKVLRDMETIGVLASDGSSDILYHALLLKNPRPISAF